MARKKTGKTESEKRGPAQEWIGTEQEWLSRVDPDDLIRTVFFLAEEGVLRPSTRKWLLFQVACIRRIRHVFRDPRSLVAVNAAEQYADGRITVGKLYAMASELQNPPNPDNLAELPREAFTADQLRIANAWAALGAVGPPPQGYCEGMDLTHQVRQVVRAASDAAAQPKLEMQVQAALLRDFIGNPFRPATLDFSWPVWNNGAVAKLAQTVYEERDFDRLPLLADALEDAGCMSADILSHCRGLGPHVRGCWVVDPSL